VAAGLSQVQTVSPSDELLQAIELLEPKRWELTDRRLTSKPRDVERLRAAGNRDLD
jgi:hypothetical protein